MHDPKDHIPFGKNIGHIEVVGVGASMDDTIHIEVQMIKLGEERFICNNLVDLGVSLAEPAIKLLEGVGGRNKYAAG